MKYRYSILLAQVLFCWQLMHPTARAESNLVSISKNAEPPHSSVLAAGNWYRFAVVKSGVYKIDTDILRKAGVDLNNIDPQKIGI